jgi:P2 family phage contractile tail tube protein
MDGTIKIEMGQEAMEATVALSSYDLQTLALWGVGEGNPVPIVARGALESLDGTVTPVVVNLNGTIRSMEMDAWKAGEKSTLKLTIDVRAYKYTQNAQVVHDIDIVNMVRIVNGKDRLTAQRNALGI